MNLEVLVSQAVKFFYDFWIEFSWVHLISWSQLILKNYLCIVLLTVHGKMWHLFAEKCYWNLLPWTIIDYHMDSIKILPYFAVNLLLCCHGQVPIIQWKDLRFYHWQSCCWSVKDICLGSRICSASAVLLHWKVYKPVTIRVLQSKRTRQSTLKCYNSNQNLLHLFGQ